MVAVTVVVNLFVAELPATWTSIDVTSTKIYSITDDTKDYLKGLDEDVTIYVLVSDASKDTKLDETLQRYESLSVTSKFPISIRLQTRLLQHSIQTVL